LLDPDVRDLVQRLRGLKDRSGLSLAALAGRTMHSKSAWGRYLNGKKLPPRHAVEALGRLAGEEPARLAAQWELAEQAWNRPPAPVGGPAPAGPAPATGAYPGSDAEAAATGAAGAETDGRPGGRAGTPSPEPGAASTAPSRSRAAHPRIRPVGVVATVGIAVAAGVIAVLAPGGRSAPPGGATGDPATTTVAGNQGLDTRCFEDGCAGQDPNDARCAGDAWTSALTQVRGVYVELRYSDACRAAWARISWGTVGDVAEVVPSAGAPRRDRVHYDTDVYSPMVPAPDPSDARACAVLVPSGVRRCTAPGGHRRLLEPPEPPTPSSATATSSATSPAVRPSGSVR
jgi:hypothetical protein